MKLAYFSQKIRFEESHKFGHRIENGRDSRTVEIGIFMIEEE
jgi:hypothetical protein